MCVYTTNLLNLYCFVVVSVFSRHLFCTYKNYQSVLFFTRCADGKFSLSAFHVSVIDSCQLSRALWLVSRSLAIYCVISMSTLWYIVCVIACVNTTLVSSMLVFCLTSTRPSLVTMDRWVTRVPCLIRASPRNFCLSKFC